jgi:hypothetical protein
MLRTKYPFLMDPCTNQSTISGKVNFPRFRDSIAMRNLYCGSRFRFLAHSLYPSSLRMAPSPKQLHITTDSYIGERKENIDICTSLESSRDSNIVVYLKRCIYGLNAVPQCTSTLVLQHTYSNHGFDISQL